jgi:hypothetical protein
MWVETFGPEVADLNDLAGMTPDPEQQLALDVIFAINAQGKSAAVEIDLIAARRAMKTAVIQMTEIGWLYVTEQPRISHTAHQLRTTGESFGDLHQMIMNSPALSRRLKPARTGKLEDAGVTRGQAQWALELATRQEIKFLARGPNGARGLGGKIVLDEGFALTESMMGAMVPIIAAEPDPQVLTASSGGKLESAVLRDKRDRGRAGEHGQPGRSPDQAYMEWGDPDAHQGCETEGCQHEKTAIGCALDDLERAARINTATRSGRVTVRTLAALRQAMPPKEYAREFFVWWEDPPTGSASTFGPGKWEACAAEPGVFPDEPLAIGVAVSVDRLRVAIAAAGIIEVPVEDGEEGETEERVFVAAVDLRDDVDWVVARAKEIQDEYDVLVAIDEKGPAADLEDDFDDADVAVEWVKLDAYAEACSWFFDRVRAGRLLHPNSAELNKAVDGAEWRWVNGDRRVWGRKKSVGDVVMLEAATLAAKAAENLGGVNIY